MELVKICTVVSSLSFICYVISYFVSPNMKKEFIRYGLQELGLYIIILQFLGAVGLIIGFNYQPLLLISSMGLSLLMMTGLIVRIRLKDSLWVSFPALFYMLLNAYIFIKTIIQDYSPN
ncbi:MAG: hypothetical protein HON09_07100 [Flavobacteriaceae bacterium]|nr:hypothetical protein [Flavobacteriaceae bacterium]